MKRASLAMKMKGTVTSTSSIGKSHPCVRQRSKVQKGMHSIPFIYSSKPHSSKENQTVLFRDAHTPSCKGKQGNNDGTGQNRGCCDHQRHGECLGGGKARLLMGLWLHGCLLYVFILPALRVCTHINVLCSSIQMT